MATWEIPDWAEATHFKTFDSGAMHYSVETDAPVYVQRFDETTEDGTVQIGRPQLVICFGDDNIMIDRASESELVKLAHRIIEVIPTWTTACEEVTA